MYILLQELRLIHPFPFLAHENKVRQPTSAYSSTHKTKYSDVTMKYCLAFVLPLHYVALLYRLDHGQDCSIGLMLSLEVHPVGIIYGDPLYKIFWYLYLRDLLILCQIVLYREQFSGPIHLNLNGLLQYYIQFQAMREVMQCSRLKQDPWMVLSL